MWGLKSVVSYELRPCVRYNPRKVEPHLKQRSYVLFRGGKLLNSPCIIVFGVAQLKHGII